MVTLLGLRLSPHLFPLFSFGHLIVFYGDATQALLEASSFPPLFLLIFFMDPTFSEVTRKESFSRRERERKKN
jgi:hypothetical protein